VLGNSFFRNSANEKRIKRFPVMISNILWARVNFYYIVCFLFFIYIDTRISSKFKVFRWTYFATLHATDIQTYNICLLQSRKLIFNIIHNTNQYFGMLTRKNMTKYIDPPAVNTPRCQIRHCIFETMNRAVSAGHV